ncbi:myosin light chain 5 [Choloepus didactylus]|uniref:myosin light chain 5 n=1 Tax=Choloepus didactylus TaxID=27675 RepID=UPI00189DE7C4|nr:myosin light chain 5 [Choloepus didactylus]
MACCVLCVCAHGHRGLLLPLCADLEKGVVAGAEPSWGTGQDLKTLVLGTWAGAQTPAQEPQAYVGRQLCASVLGVWSVPVAHAAAPGIQHSAGGAWGLCRLGASVGPLPPLGPRPTPSPQGAAAPVLGPRLGVGETPLPSPAQAHPDDPRSPSQASRKAKKKEGGALRAQRASSNVFSNFEQTQIQEFKEAFTLMDQNRDGFIDKEDLKDTYASLGKINVKDDELDAMLKEASGPINFTMFLNLFGEKLTGTDTEETILNAFKMLDPEGKGSIHRDYIKRMLMSQADRMTAEEVDQMFQFASIDAAGNLDYKALSYVLTHGEEKEE